MTDANAAIEASPLGDNLLFRGGGQGGDGLFCFMIWNRWGSQLLDCQVCIREDGMLPLEACASGEADVDDFKIFFNFCQFNEPEMEDLLKSNEDGDCWASGEGCGGLKSRLNAAMPGSGCGMPWRKYKCELVFTSSCPQ
jgi:hypothetical protein